MPEHTAHQVGTVKVLHGSAVAASDGGTRALNQGDPVFHGEAVTTGEDSALEIRFLDETVLSQAENSIVKVDTYVYDPDTDAGEVLFKLTQGTFRSITGKIVDHNPEKFKVQSPLAVIGIRGTHTGHFVPEGGGGENHGCLEFDGKPVVVQSLAGGPPVSLFQSGISVGATSAGLGPAQPYTPGQLDYFNALSPESMAMGAPPPEPPSDFAPEDDADDGQDDLPVEPGDPGTDDEAGVESPEGAPEGAPEDGPDASVEGPPATVLAPQGVLGAPAGPGTGMLGETPDAVPGLEPDSEGGMPDGGGLGESVLPELVFAEPDVPDPAPEPEPYLPEEFDLTADGGDGVEEVVQTVASTVPVEVPDTGDTGDAAPPTSGSLLHGVWSGTTADFASHYTGVDTEGVFVNIGYSGAPSPYGDSTPFVVYDNYPASSPGEDHESLPSQIVNVFGSPQYDSLYGNDSANTLMGRCGNDHVYGMGGADWLAGGNENDTIYGGDGDDHITGDNPFTVSGSEGSDEIYGENGNDLIYGSKGSDTIYGGDTASDTGTHDVLSYSYPEGPYSYPSGLTITLSGPGAGSATDGTDTDSFQGIEEVVGSGNNDTFTGNTGDDTFDGAGGNDDMAGAGGNDHMHGGAGNDILLGDAGNDELDGDDGADTLDGGAGNDTLDGGSGADQFVYDAVAEVGPANRDVITDFTHGEDTIVVDKSGGAAFPTNTAAEIGAPTSPVPTVFYDDATLAADYAMYYDSDGSTGGTDLTNPLAVFAGDPGIDAGDIALV